MEQAKEAPVKGPKIFLVGMMGSGKSYWSKWLSKKFKTGGYDLDFLIESNEEKTIAEIFAEDGEDYFRKQEAKVLRWFKEKKAFVLATGGGTPCFNENMEWMNKHGLTIWINPAEEIIWERLIKERQTRPLVASLAEDKLRDFIHQKLLERKPYYEKARSVINQPDITISEFVNTIQHAKNLL